MAENDQVQNPQEQLNPQEAQGKQIHLQTIYAKDISLETPNSPEIFLEEYKPDMKISLANNVKELQNDAYEADLQVTVTAKVGEKTAFIAEVKYGGVFNVSGYDESTTAQILRTFCPEQLFPYVREAISESIARAGFPRFILTPVNFNSLYEQARQQNQAGQPAEGQA
ncbi:protein-export chaperone SecB [Kangiella sp. HZ709]|uniref:protein-export chaperone SecB n=1 Tax=Kangiella sp. HZ709 TaxID=2666328 RepID=UPI0012B01428|nr:protein-export chaperone SecB [Kangiella sp. HZ709]MRX28236.1 protein-export chaperone SecB [Kangiella sp. HZ709]